MDYKLSIRGFEGRTILVRQPGFLSDFKLLVDGQPALKGARRGEMIVRRNDGTESIATWKKTGLGLDAPKLLIDGQVISFADPLRWYEWIWSGLPVILVFTGGALGGMIGALAFSLNARIFRAPVNVFLRFLFTAAISVLAVLLYFLIVFLIFGLPE